MPGAPSRTSFEIFADRPVLTPSEWLELVEARRRKIKSLFKHSSLPTLGDLQCMADGGSKRRNLRGDFPEGFALLQIQGLFYLSPRAETSDFSPGLDWPIDHRPDGRKIAWGLSRDEGWMIVEIYFQKFQKITEQPTQGREKAVLVDVRNVPLGMMLNESHIPAILVLTELGYEISRMAERRKDLYESALKLSLEVNVEERMIQAFINRDPTLVSILKQLLTE